MNNTKILRAIGGINDELIERAGQRKEVKRTSFTPQLKWAAPLAACLIIAVMVALPLLNNGADFDLSLSSGVSVRHINNPPIIHSAASLVYLTEEEMFAEYFHGYEIVIFGGTVKEVNNIVMDFNGHEMYRAIAKIEVSEALRGAVQIGDIVSVLLPAPVSMEDFWVSDTSVSSQITPGTRGFFTPIRYDETSIIRMNEATLFLSEIAVFGLPDGERWAFIETPDGLVFARSAYESIADATSLDDVRQYINDMIEKN